MAARVDRSGIGGFTESLTFPTPLSDSFERTERQLAGVEINADGAPVFFDTGTDAERDTFEANVRSSRAPARIAMTASSGQKVILTGAQAAAQVGVAQTQTMPPDVLAAMRLAEYYVNVEGDVRQTIEIPMDVAIRPVEVEHGDPGVVKFFEELYGPLYMNVDAAIEDMWLSLEIYGAAYVYELWDKGRPPDRATLNRLAKDPGSSLPSLVPQSIGCLNPKYVYVGQSPFAGSPSLSLVPAGKEGAAFRNSLAQNLEPGLTYNALSVDVHDLLPWAWNVPLNPGSVTQLRDKSNRFVRYPWPSLMSCFRTLSTRQILEEMIRAIIEGSKNQLWFFGLGDASHRPTKVELDALSGAVNGLAGRRTGNLVWGGHLRIEVHTPKVEPQLANDKWTRLTEHFFRQRGISLHIVSGESTSTSGGPESTSDSIDVKVFMERMTYKTNHINRDFLIPLTRRVCLLSGDPALVKLARTNTMPSVKMGDYSISAESQIKNKVAPLYQMGLTSPQTALKSAGHNFDQELSNKQLAAPHTDLFSAPATFSQTTQGPGGPKTASSQRGQNKTRGNPRTTTDKGRRTGTGGQRGKQLAASSEGAEGGIEDAS